MFINPWPWDKHNTVEPRDLIVAPVVIILIYIFAYLIRPRVTDATTRRYFIPALSIRMFGAIALGLIYHFYYQGGDTFNYHTHGSRIIYEAFIDSSWSGLKLIFGTDRFDPTLWEYTRSIWYIRDAQSFFIIRMAAIIDLFTFSSYLGTALIFSVLSFIGGWMLFQTFYIIRPLSHRWAAISCLFIPSVIFWGSGILKDTVSVAFLFMATYYVHRLAFQRRLTLFNFIGLFISLFFIYSIKKYILICFIAAVMVWFFAQFLVRVRSIIARIMMVPIVTFLCVTLAYFSINMVVEEDSRYALDKIAITSKITAYDIRYGWGKDAGTGYSLGELDGSFGTMLRLAPAAINVSLFRPYLWEVKNPLMLLSALESLFMLIGTLYLLIRLRGRLFKGFSPEVTFCLTFALIFAFGVGISTYNFGTLARYKIPMMPFYVMALGLMLEFVNIRQKAPALTETE